MPTFLDQLLDLEKAPQALPYSAEGYNLERFSAFVESLGSPHRRLHFVHIAGTKGKGSTAALTEAILRGMGFPTAMFTSPHLSHYGERYRFNGVPWSMDEFTAACTRFWELLGPEQRLGFTAPQPWRTVFESLTALALVEFEHFAQVTSSPLPTIVVWETGLGGRLDCTNIVDPLVSVITALGLDHVAILGGSIESITREKAGIMKPGRPVIIGRQSKEDEAAIWPVLLHRASEVGAPLIRAEQQCPVRPISGTNPQLVEATLPDGREVRLRLPLRGAFQHGNLEAALAACWEVHRLFRRGGPETFDASGVADAYWPGRVQILTRGGDATLIIDGAHCPLSAAALGNTVRELYSSAARQLIFGMQRDKNASGFLQRYCEALAIEPRHLHLAVYTVPGGRGAKAEDLASIAHSIGIESVTIHASAAEALAAFPSGVVVAAGTLYTIEALRAAWEADVHARR